MNSAGTSLLRKLYLVLTLGGALILSIESILALFNKSICTTKACEVVGRYLAISEAHLVTLGAIFLWVLFLVFYFSGKYQNGYRIPLFFLAPALAVDSSLIGFQIFTIQQNCVLCIAVAVLLIVISLIYCLDKKLYLILLCLSLIWIGCFTSHKIMRMPPPTAAYSKMIFSPERAAPKHKAEKPMPKLTLIMSMNCDHCLKVIQYLANQYPKFNNIQLASIDSDISSLQKIASFLEKQKEAENPYQLLGDLKKTPLPPDGMTHKSLAQKGTNSLTFLSNLGIREIPVLLVENSQYQKEILIGSDKILSFLSNLNLQPPSD